MNRPRANPLPPGVRLLPLETLRLHPEAGRIPEMRPAELEELVADILDRGIRQPIQLQPGTRTILDGRFRWMGGRLAGLTEVPVIDSPINGDDAVIYMIRSATRRRHLTDDQRAMLAQEELDWLAAAGKKTSQANLVPAGAKSRGSKARLDLAKSSKSSPPEEPPAAEGTAGRQTKPPTNSRAVVARAHRVSEHRLRSAALVNRRGGALAEQVKQGELPLARAVAQIRRQEKHAALQSKADAVKATAGDRGAPAWEIRTGDCLQLMPELHKEGKRYRLIFADPPYNIGVDYGDGAGADDMAPPDYRDWCAAWIRKAAQLLSDDGSFWILINHEWAADYKIRLGKAGLHIRAHITWHETFGVNAANNFNRTSRPLLYAVKDPRRFVFHASAVMRPSARQLKYADRRADPAGKLWDDVWGIAWGPNGEGLIPRLVGNAAERIAGVPTQLPLALLRPIVACSSDPGDEVLDPFSGSATTGHAALELGRRYLGLEKRRPFAELSELRLRALGAAKIGEPDADQKKWRRG